MAASGCKMSGRRADSSGFTLVELMIALALTGIIATAMYTFFLGQQRSATVQQDLVGIQQDLRAVMQALTRDIRMAGYDPTGSGTFGFVVNGTFATQKGVKRTVGTTGSSLACTMDLNGNGRLDVDAQDMDGNETTDLREMEQVGYRLTNDGQLQRFSTTTGAILWATLAENIQGLAFTYHSADGKAIADLDPITMPLVRSVTVSILIRARFPDPSFTNTSAYPGFNEGAPYNDRFRRRLLVMNVQCRNR